MKKRLLIATVLTAFCIVSVFGGSAMAAAKWYECSIVNIGVNSAGVCTIRVYNATQANERAFLAATGQENTMLAVALTALSLSYDVFVNVDSWVNQTTINDIRVSAP